MQFDTLLELSDMFPNEESCKKYLEKVLWANGEPVCAHCKNTKKIYRFATKPTQFKCGKCRKQFTVTVGTIFHGTHVPLRKWIFAIYLFTTHKKGVSAHQLARDLKITVKTAWFMKHRLRTAFENMDFGAPIEGTVTVDESFWGMKAKNIHYHKRPKHNQGRKGENKLKIFTMLETNGKVKSVHVQDLKSQTLKGIIFNHVSPGTTIQSDEYNAYNGLSWMGYNHIKCDHGRYQYVNKENGATTNAIENYWSHIKRAIIGTYYHVSKKHIQSYLSEFDYKFNTRNKTDIERFNLAILGSQGRLKYSQLINKLN